MFAIALVLGLISLAMLCRMVFVLAVHALPFFVAVSLGLAMLDTGYDVTGAFLAGVVAGVLAAATGRLLFAVVPGVALPMVITTMFVLPAAIAGYHAAWGLSGVVTSSLFLQRMAGCLSAVLVGGAAWRELAGSDVSGASRAER